MTTRPGDDQVVTFTLTGDHWHLALRELVYVVSTLEKLQQNVLRAADRRRDAWVLAALEPLTHAVEAQDRALELLQDAQLRHATS